MKPIVHYRGKAYIPGVGSYAICSPIDHKNHVPGQAVSNTKEVLTSRIVAIGNDGEFETQNTIYRPVNSGDRT